jgi:hypothetical protein
MLGTFIARLDSGHDHHLTVLLRYGFVLLSAWISNTEKTIITAAEIQPNLAEAVAEGLGAGGKGCLRITGSQVRWSFFCCSPAIRSASLLWSSHNQNLDTGTHKIRMYLVHSSKVISYDVKP